MNDQDINPYPISQPQSPSILDVNGAHPGVPLPTDPTPVSSDAGIQDSKKNTLSGMLVILERLARQAVDDNEVASDFNILITTIKRRIGNG